LVAKIDSSIMLEDEFPIQVLPTLMNKTLINYVQSALAECMIATCIFNLKVFMVDVNLLFTNWKPKHIIVGLFEAHDTFGFARVVKFKHP
jgi:hypothetical protein